MKSLVLDPELHKALNSFSSRTFTAGQLVVAYRAAADQDATQKDDNYIYRQIHRLKMKGLIITLNKKSKGNQCYKLSETFGKQAFHHQSSKALSDSINDHSSGTIACDLRQRLKETELELLTLLGETEEYQALMKIAGNTSIDIETLFKDSRENSSKLLGKIQALNNVISQTESST